MLEVIELDKSYEGEPLLRHVSFHVEQNETICLLGPSGSGKSTLLLIIAGLETPDAGDVHWSGKSLADVPAHERDFGLVFQDYALFPHLDVFDNIAYGLRMKRRSRQEISRRVAEVLQVVDLQGFEHRKVTDLSGGEQQRVALARALAPQPRLLMFDEPLGALDRALRENLLVQLRRILHETGLPAIYVTHDQEEASTIADRVLLLHDGVIAREGAVADVWTKPGSPWAAEFLGLGTILDGQILGGGDKAETAYGALRIRCDHEHRAGDKVRLLVRPIAAKSGSTIRGRVKDVVFQQERYRVTLEGGLVLLMDTAPTVGANIAARVPVECLG